MMGAVDKQIQNDLVVLGIADPGVDFNDIIPPINNSTNTSVGLVEEVEPVGTLSAANHDQYEDIQDVVEPVVVQNRLNFKLMARPG